MTKEELISKVVERKIAKKDEAEAEYDRIVKEAEKQFDFLPPEERLKRAERNFVIFFKELVKSDLQFFEGIVLKSTGKDFITKRRIEKIMREYNEDPQKVIDEGKVKIEDGQPVAIDPLKYWNAGKPNQRDNPRYQKPLDENSVQRTVWGVFMYEDKEKNFELTLRDNAVYNLNIPLVQPVKMKVALGGSIDEDTIRLIARRGTRFDVMEDKEIDIVKMVENKYGKDLIEIGEIEDALSKKDPKDYSFYRMVKGQVMDLNLTPKADGSCSFRLIQESMDFDKNFDCRVKIPEEWVDSIDFGEFSTVYVYGNPWVFTPEGQSKMVGITAYGLYPVEKVKPAKTNGAKKSDVNGNGEVPKEAEEFKDFNK